MMLTRFSRYSPAKCIIENATLYDVTYVDGEDNPLAVFNFSYRSKGKAELPVIRTYEEIAQLLTFCFC